jgi:hypothetical protein
MFATASSAGIVIGMPMSRTQARMCCSHCGADVDCGDGHHVTTSTKAA